MWKTGRGAETLLLLLQEAKQERGREGRERKESAHACPISAVPSTTLNQGRTYTRCDQSDSPVQMGWMRLSCLQL